MSQGHFVLLRMLSISYKHTRMFHQSLQLLPTMAICVFRQKCGCKDAIQHLMPQESCLSALHNYDHKADGGAEDAAQHRGSRAHGVQARLNVPLWQPLHQQQAHACSKR